MQGGIPELIEIQFGADVDEAVFNDERAVYVFTRHQLVQLDTRGMQQFLLFHVLRAVGIEVYFGLLVVQAGEVTDVIPFLYDAQALFGERYGVAEIFQTDGVLHVVVVLGGDVGYEVFDGDTGVGFALAFQLFQLLVVGGDVEAVEDSPVQIKPHVHGLIEYTILFDMFSGSPHFAVCIVYGSFITCREVKCRQITGVSQRSVVFADLFLVAGNAQRVVILKSVFQAGL